MNTLFSQLSTYSTSIFLKSARSILGSSSFYSTYSNLSCSKGSIVKCRVNIINGSHLGSSALSKFGGIQCCYYSTKKGSTRKRKPKPKPEPLMQDEKEAFFVVRKGDVIGVYKSFSDCQAQAGSSISEPPVSVYKGYSLPKEAEEHLVSRGLQNALYAIKTSDLNDDLFGTLTPCPFQEPASSADETSSMDSQQKTPHDELASENTDADGVSLISTDPSNKLQKSDSISCDSQTCVLEFDGASKGNPGPAGAGAVLRSPDGNVICKIHQGLGTATNNVAEYRAIILGLKRALEMGYTSIQVKGDSKLVCMQLQGLWRVRNETMVDLHAEADELKDKFTSFQIKHVLRKRNADADEQANLGVALADGQLGESPILNVTAVTDGQLGESPS